MEDTPLLNDPLFSFYEDLHLFEMNSREKMDSKFQLFLTGAIALMGFLAALLKDAPQTTLMEMPLYVYMGVLAYTFIFMSGFFFIKSYLGHKYKFFAKSDIWEKYRGDLKSHYNTIDITKPNTEFTKSIFNSLITISTYNAEINQTRSGLIERR